MALFNMFGAKPKEEFQLAPVELEEPKETETTEEAASDEKKDEEKKHLITITWGTGLPIDVIFNYIHKNFEEDGFQDALVNSDITYRDAKEKIIRNDLEMLFKRIILCYKKNIREIDVQINNARQAYALAAASSLEARRVTYEEHMAEIDEMREQFEADDPKMMTMIESYRRGFLKGITAISLKFINHE